MFFTGIIVYFINICLIFLIPLKLTLLNCHHFLCYLHFLFIFLLCRVKMFSVKRSFKICVLTAPSCQSIPMVKWSEQCKEISVFHKRTHKHTFVFVFLLLFSCFGFSSQTQTVQEALQRTFQFYRQQEIRYDCFSCLLSASRASSLFLSFLLFYDSQCSLAIHLRPVIVCPIPIISTLPLFVHISVTHLHANRSQPLLTLILPLFSVFSVFLRHTNAQTDWHTHTHKVTLPHFWSLPLFYSPSLLKYWIQ